MLIMHNQDFVYVNLTFYSIDRSSNLVIAILKFIFSEETILIGNRLKFTSYEIINTQSNR